jgi:Ca2+/H+ antiporter, TMEM165/GDT1 family
MIHWHVLLSVFGVIFIAELPDKTAVAALVLATRHKPTPVFVGAASALALQSAVAVAAGGVVSLLPARIVHVIAGLVFVVSAIVMWRGDGDASDDELRDSGAYAGFWRTARLAFVIVFVAEWGDLTQLATAAFAARYRAPLSVFAGATAALSAVAATAVFVGHRSRKYVNPRVTQKVAAVVFALAGVALLLGYG